MQASTATTATAEAKKKIKHAYRPKTALPGTTATPQPTRHQGSLTMFVSRLRLRIKHAQTVTNAQSSTTAFHPNASRSTTSHPARAPLTNASASPAHGNPPPKPATTSMPSSMAPPSTPQTSALHLMTAQCAHLSTATKALLSLTLDFSTLAFTSARLTSMTVFVLRAHQGGACLWVRRTGEVL